MSDIDTNTEVVSPSDNTEGDNPDITQEPLNEDTKVTEPSVTGPITQTPIIGGDASQTCVVSAVTPIDNNIQWSPKSSVLEGSIKQATYTLNKQATIDKKIISCDRPAFTETHPPKHYNKI